MFVKLPFVRAGIGAREQPVSKNVKPEKLLALGMPQRSFAQGADAIIINPAHVTALS